ncbi:MAG: DsbA family protein [Reyranellaceae bacterium]
MPEMWGFSRRAAARLAGAFLIATVSATLQGGLAAPARAQTQDVLKVTDKDRVLGDPNAKVTIIEYASLTCPHCAGFHTAVLPELKKLYIDTGKAKLVYRDFPLDRAAAQASLLAECVPADRYFAMIDMLFQTQAQWSQARDPLDALSKAGRLVGIDDVKFRACQDDKEALAAIIAERQAAEQIGVGSTPTLFINGEKYAGTRPVADYQKIIDDLLK